MRLGRDEVAQLLPHGAALRLVDEVVAWTTAPGPALTATFKVAPDHPVLAAHFPSRPLWPGVYLVEGLAQAALLLGTVSGGVGGRGGMLAAIDVRLTSPVVPGDDLTYHVEETHVVDRLRRYRCEARAGERLVARGALTVALGDGS